MSKKIQLTKNKFALVDDADYEWLNQWKWTLDGSGYAIRYTREGRENRKKIIMSRAILKPKNKKILVDHINLNKLDYRRSNLRFCSWKDNIRNRKKLKNNSSGFKGVCFHRGKWLAQIGITENKKRKCIYVGTFDDKKDAAKAYDEAARKYHGDFARVNFPRANELKA